MRDVRVVRGIVRSGVCVGTAFWLLACAGVGDGPPPSGPLAPEQAVAEVKKVVAAHKDEPLGLCDFDHGWGYAAIRLLDQSTKPAESAEAANRDPALSALTHTDLFGRWYQSRTTSIASEEDLRTFLRQANTWYDPANGAPRRLMLHGNGKYEVRKLGVLGEPESTGDWGVENGKLWIELESGRREITIEQGPWSFEMNAGTLGIFLPEPMTGKC